MSLEKHKILVVDDDSTILLVLTATLEEAGFDVLSTTDPYNVLPLLDRSRPDAIVLDILMPKLSGWDLLSQIRRRAQNHSTPVILLSALKGSAHRVRGLRSGADDFMIKPFDPDELVARLEMRISQKSHEAAGMQGHLELHSIHELVQNLESGAKTGRLEISCEEITGTLLLRDGKAVDARWGAFRDLTAVKAILELRQGRFRFTPCQLGEELIAKEGIRFTPLLMEEAWVADESSARQGFLPSPEASLALAGELGPLPENLAGLPFTAVFRYLELHPGTSLAELLDQHLDSPGHVRLAVAWLREQGLLEVANPSPQKPSGEELDVALREFFQDALFRGFRLDQLAVRLRVQPGAWDSLAPLLVEIADPLLNAAGHATKRKIFIEQGGELELRHENGRLRLCFDPLDPAGIPPLDGLNGIVLWLEEHTSGASLAAVASDIESHSPPNASLLVIAPSESTHQRAAALLGAASRWRFLRDPPRTLERFLMELVQAPPA